jgi:hypothetical protein
MTGRNSILGAALAALLTGALPAAAAPPPAEPPPEPSPPAAPTPAQAQGQGQGQGQAPAIDPSADAQMKKMSDYLGNLRSFSFKSDSVDEAVTKEGQKVQFVAGQQVYVRRPNRLRADRLGPVANTQFHYDGQTYAVYGKKTGYYATAPAPARLDQAIDDVREKLGIDAPGADLLMSNPYATLMGDVISGQDLGIEPIDNVPCHHLAFRNKDVDWQIWIQDGPQPLPRRYSIVTKDETGQPEYSIDLSNWNTNVSLPDQLFTFTPPPCATRIDIKPPAQPTPGN